MRVLVFIVLSAVAVASLVHGCTQCTMYEKEKVDTLDVQHARYIRVKPGQIIYTRLEGETFTRKVPPGASVRWKRTLGPAEPFRIEQWTVSGRVIIDIYTYEGYPLYE